MKPEDFIQHGCEQILRFTQVKQWDDLPEKIKVQLSFNIGVVALGLNLSKEEGFIPLAQMSQEEVSIATFREHMLNIIKSKNITVDEAQIARPF